SWNEDKVFVDQTAIQDDDLRHLECFLVVDVLWASKTDIGDKGLEHLSNWLGCARFSLTKPE
ncbi:MAG TPA: hypothetical protein VFI31_17335, partial [Pirellulales bacterium]|nr:hypothetical protein [Pirellulales bacterium]